MPDASDDEPQSNTNPNIQAFTEDPTYHDAAHCCGWSAVRTCFSPRRPGRRSPGVRDLLRQRISADDRAWLKQATQRQLDGCRVRSDDGRWMYTPDGVGTYRAL